MPGKFFHTPSPLQGLVAKKKRCTNTVAFVIFSLLDNKLYNFGSGCTKLVIVFGSPLCTLHLIICSSPKMCQCSCLCPIVLLAFLSQDVTSLAYPDGRCALPAAPHRARTAVRAVGSALGQAHWPPPQAGATSGRWPTVPGVTHLIACYGLCVGHEVYRLPANIRLNSKTTNA